MLSTSHCPKVLVDFLSYHVNISKSSQSVTVTDNYVWPPPIRFQMSLRAKILAVISEEMKTTVVCLTVSLKLWLQCIKNTEWTEVQRADFVGTKYQELKEQCSAWSLLLPSSLPASHQRLSLSSTDLVSLMRSDSPGAWAAFSPAYGLWKYHAHSCNNSRYCMLTRVIRYMYQNT